MAGPSFPWILAGFSHFRRLSIKKTKQRSSPSLLRFPNIYIYKKDSYTNYLKWDHAKQFSVYNNHFSPSVLLYTIARDKIGWQVPGWKMSCLQKRHAGQFILCVQVTLHCTYFCVVFRRHMELKFLAARFYSTIPQISTETVPALQALQGCDSRHYCYS